MYANNEIAHAEKEEFLTAEKHKFTITRRGQEFVYEFNNTHVDTRLWCAEFLFRCAKKGSSSRKSTGESCLFSVHRPFQRTCFRMPVCAVEGRAGLELRRSVSCVSSSFHQSERVGVQPPPPPPRCTLIRLAWKCNFRLSTTSFNQTSRAILVSANQAGIGFSKKAFCQKKSAKRCLPNSETGSFLYNPIKPITSDARLGDPESATRLVPRRQPRAVAPLARHAGGDGSWCRQNLRS